MKLLTPTLELLPRYVEALERGWSPNNVRVEETPELVSYAAQGNHRSVAVMRRLGMREGAAFDHPALPEAHRLRRHRLLTLSACS
jgi:hypothetical protein